MKKHPRQPKPLTMLPPLPQAERNRLAREAKKQAEAAKTQNTAVSNSTGETTTNSINSATDESSSNSGYLILGVGGLIVFALGVYYQREAIMKTLGRKEAAPAETAPPVEDSTPAAPKRKFGICEMK